MSLTFVTRVECPSVASRAVADVLRPRQLRSSGRFVAIIAMAAGRVGCGDGLVPQLLAMGCMF